MDAERILARAEHAYERSRMTLATWQTLPLAFLVGLALFLGGRVQTSLMLGAALLALGWFFAWRGRELGRAILPGVAAGVVPLALALAAQAYGHVCTGSGCMSLCVPACSFGGAVAGFLVAYAARASTARGRTIAASSALALLGGSLGCSCVGYGGVVGLGVGLAATLVPTALVLRRA